MVCHLVARTVAQHAAKGRAKVPAYLKRLKEATGSVGFGGRFNDLVWTDGFRRAATEYCEETSRAGSGGYLYVIDVPMRFWGKRIPSSHGIDVPLTFNIWDDPAHRCRSLPTIRKPPRWPAGGYKCWATSHAMASRARRWVTGRPTKGSGARRCGCRVIGCRLEHDVDSIFRQTVWEA